MNTTIYKLLKGDRMTLESFLREYDILHRYLQNGQNGHSPREFLEYTFTPNVISKSFRWADTPEGYSFWSEYNNLWNKQL